MNKTSDVFNNFFFPDRISLFKLLDSNLKYFTLQNLAVNSRVEGT